MRELSVISNANTAGRWMFSYIQAAGRAPGYRTWWRAMATGGWCLQIPATEKKGRGRHGREARAIGITRGRPATSGS